MFPALPCRGVSALFCRHNRFTAECPICSRGTPLGPTTPSRRRGPRAAPASPQAGPGQFRGPYAAAGPYGREGGERVEVRLERVPGGLRLGEWVDGSLQRRAPVLASADVIRLVNDAVERAVVARGPEQAVLRRALEEAPDGSGGTHGASAGRSGDLREELRLEPIEGGSVRVGRWVLRPGSGWILQQAPTMYPAGRYAEAIAAARRAGLVPSAA